MITSFNELVAYFRALAAEHPAINDFVFGPSERFLARESSRTVYPIVWLIPPDVVPESGGEAIRFRYEFTLFFFANGPLDDWENEDANMAILEAACKDFVARMQYDERENRLFNFRLQSSSMQPKMAYSGDNNHGWVLEGNLTTIGEYCYDPENWTA